MCCGFVLIQAVILAFWKFIKKFQKMHVFEKKEKSGFEKYVLKDLCLLDNNGLHCCGLKFEMVVSVMRFVGRSQVLRDLGFLLEIMGC